MVNLNIATLALLFPSSHAFSSLPSASFKGNHLFGVQSNTKLFKSNTDSTEAIEAALDASKKYGATSKEARVLWDIVEEISSSDNSSAYTGGISEDECLLNGEGDPECEKYYKKLSKLYSIMEENRYRIDQANTLAEELQAMEIAEPRKASTELASNLPEMKKAIEEAQAATEKHGITSPEAKIAWETVEEIAASNNSEASLGTLEDECLIESKQACDAMEELSRAINLLKSDSRYQG